MIEYYHSAPVVSLQLPGFRSPTQHRTIASPSPINLAGMGTNTSHPNALLSRWFSRVPLEYLVIYMGLKLGTTNLNDFQNPMGSMTFFAWYLQVTFWFFRLLPPSWRFAGTVAFSAEFSERYSWRSSESAPLWAQTHVPFDCISSSIGGFCFKYSSCSPRSLGKPTTNQSCNAALWDAFLFEDVWQT